MKQLRLRIDKCTETDFTRFLYNDGSEASSEKKENIQGSKKNSTESRGRDTGRATVLRHMIKADAKNYRYTEQRFTGSSRIYHMSTKQTMNTEELGNPRTDLWRKR